MLYPWPPVLPIASEFESCVSSNFKRDNQSHTFCSLKWVQSSTFCYVLSEHSAEELALKHATLFLVRVMHFNVLHIICSLVFSVRRTATNLLKTTSLYRLRKDPQGGLSHLLINEIQFLIRSSYPMQWYHHACGKQSQAHQPKIPQGAVTKYFIFCSLLLFIYYLQNKNKEIYSTIKK